MRAVPKNRSARRSCGLPRGIEPKPTFNEEGGGERAGDAEQGRENEALGVVRARHIPAGCLEDALFEASWRSSFGQALSHHPKSALAGGGPSEAEAL